MLKTMNLSQSVYPSFIIVNAVMQDMNWSNRIFIELENLGHLAGWADIYIHMKLAKPVSHDEGA